MSHFEYGCWTWVLDGELRFAKSAIRNPKSKIEGEV
jgi:hypothetical protein